MQKEYTEKFGRIVNPDNAKKLFIDVGYRGTNARAVQEASSALSKDVWRKTLKSNPEKDAVLYAGSSGSGKTTAVKNLLPKQIDSASAILDGNLSKYSSARDRIAEAVRAGKRVVIDYVYREPVDAWINGVIKRMRTNAEEMGRIVPMSVFMENLKGSYETVKKLADEGFKVYFIDNSLGGGKQKLMSREKFDTITFDSSLEQKLRTETKKLLDSGEITQQQYEELTK
jgi:hypothetical protein